jgi:hypothetical protein
LRHSHAERENDHPVRLLGQGHARNAVVATDIRAATSGDFILQASAAFQILLFHAVNDRVAGGLR